MYLRLCVQETSPGEQGWLPRSELRKKELRTLRSQAKDLNAEEREDGMHPKAPNATRRVVDTLFDKFPSV